MKDRYAKPSRKKVKWSKVKAPQTWRPKPGNELSGHYVGRTVKNGAFGQYEVCVVVVPFKGTFMVSGVSLIQQLDAAPITKGDPIKIVYQGMTEPPRGRRSGTKLFDVYIGEESDEDDDEIDQQSASA